MTAKKLSKTAYEIKPGETYVPYTHGQSLAEFTFKAVFSGIILGVIFGAANTYLGLKAGLTISTSIPVAVLTVVLFRMLNGFGVQHTILEGNMSQTIGSASSSVASGVLFTIPALFIWGMDPAWRQITLLSMGGGLIGVLAMIPLRRYLIRQEHGTLPYPEGMACAEVLVAADNGGQQAAGVFWGLGAGMAFKLLTDGFKLAKSTFNLALGYKAGISVAVSPPLIGVGYILGIRTSSIMAAGGALSALIIIPLINFWGADFTAPQYPETMLLIRDMTAGQIWNRYIRYIGAGAVATGGILALIRSLPTMVESFRLALNQMGKKSADTDRTDRDLSIKPILFSAAAVLGVFTLVPGILGYLDSIPVRFFASILIAIFAFFFVTVSARIVGIIGVTSNPTSGMTIATLLATSFLFYLLGWTDMAGKATALMVGTAVCIAASIAGDTSQDLKTGYILGATPYRQQIGELIGVITSAGVVCLVVALLHKYVEGGLGGAELPAPQAMLMKLVIDGVIEQNLPWGFIGIGAAIGLTAAVAGIPVLAFAVGVYLPMSTMAAVFVGGLLRHLLTRNKSEEVAEERREKGILFGSGLVGGGGLTGVLLALWIGIRGGGRIEGIPLDIPGYAQEIIALATILLLVGIMWRYITGSSRSS